MSIDSVMEWIAQASDEESLLAIKALVERRREILKDGEVIYEEHTKEEIALLRELIRYVPAYSAYKESKGETDCHASVRTGSQ